MIPVEMWEIVPVSSEMELYQAAEKEQMIIEILRGSSNGRSFRLMNAELESSSIWPARKEVTLIRL